MACTCQPALVIICQGADNGWSNVTFAHLPEDLPGKQAIT